MVHLKTFNANTVAKYTASDWIETITSLRESNNLIKFSEVEYITVDKIKATSFNDSLALALIVSND